MPGLRLSGNRELFRRWSQRIGFMMGILCIPLFLACVASVSSGALFRMGYLCHEYFVGQGVGKFLRVVAERYACKQTPLFLGKYVHQRTRDAHWLIEIF